MMRRWATLGLITMVAVGTAWGLVYGAQTLRAPLREGRFPDKGFIMYDRGTITFSVLDQAGSLVEDLKLSSFMKIALGAGYTGKDGRRHFDFQIQGWEVFGPSKVLGGNLIITLPQGVEQPMSTGTSQTRDADFPADLLFNAIYDVYLDHDVVLRRYKGRGFARRVTTLPPDVEVHIEHLFDIEHRPLSNGICGNMEIITSTEYEEAAAKARALRGAK